MAEQTICEQCGKETASVFVSRKNGDTETKQALCLQCAEKRKIPSVKEYIRRNKAAGCRMCERCGELPATVFAAVTADGRKQKQEAFCAFCARERGLPQFAETMANMEMSDEAIRQIHADILNRAQKPEGFRQKLRRIFKKS